MPSQLSVLIIDSDADDVWALARSVRAASPSAHVRIANEAGAGLKLIAAAPPDLIFFAHRTPRLTPVIFSERLGAIEGASRSRLVATAAQYAPNEIRALTALGFKGFIKKGPAGWEQVKTMVRELERDGA